MGKEQILFKSEEKMSSKEAAELLRLLAEKLESGKVTLQRGGKEVVLKVPSRVEVEVKAEQETGKNKKTKKLEVEIEWLVGGKGKGSSGPLTVR